MSRLQSAEECQTQEENTGLNTGTNPSKERQQLSCRQLIADAVKARANKYTIAEGNNISPLDIAVQAGDVKSLDIFFDCVDLDDKVKTRMVRDAYTNFFHRNFRQFTDSHISMAKRLLELGADVNGGPSVFPLSVAITAGSYPLVELLCRHGADLNKTDWESPLIIASGNGHYDIIEVMLKFGVNVHEKNLYYSSLDCALSYGHIKCAELLMLHGAHFNVEIALRNIIHKRSVDYINFLLVNCSHEFQQYIFTNQQDLLMSAMRGANIEFISHIIDLVFDITGEYPCWEQLLAQSGNGEVATLMIRKGADVNKMIKTSCGSYTPLHLVLCREDMCHTHKLQVVKVLLENGASHICCDTLPLMLVAITRYGTDLIQLLLDYGADINWRDNAGDTAFSYSVYQGCDNNAEFLIRHADKDFINSQNSDGLTVLMQAARYSNVAVVKGVMNHNPDVDMTDNNGNTALLHAINRIADDACDYGTGDIVTALINSGCDVNLQNDDGLSPLMLAASRCSSEVIQILLDAGADVNAVSKADKTKTAVSYFTSESFIRNTDITACLALFLSRGACLSYLQPKMFHRILFCDDSDTICKIITNGPGPVTVRSDEYFNYFSPTDPIFDVSPLCSALVGGNVSLARHFVDIMFLTKCDLTLMHNKPVRSYLKKKNLTQCFNLLDEMSSQPVSLFRLAFVEVSSAVGTTHGRDSRVNVLPLPWLVKDKMLFQSAVDFTIPTIKKMPFCPLPLDPYPKMYVRLIDCCKCCHVWQNLKCKNRLRKEYMYCGLCFTCTGHSCSECFRVF